MPTSVGKQLKQFNLFYAAHISLFNLWFSSRSSSLIVKCWSGLSYCGITRFYWCQGLFMRPDRWEDPGGHWEITNNTSRLWGQMKAASFTVGLNRSGNSLLSEKRRYSRMIQNLTSWVRIENDKPHINTELIRNLTTPYELTQYDVKKLISVK